MVFLVVFLFFSCLGCLREGVWTKYTPDDVARWHARSAEKTAVPRLPLPAQRLVSSRPPDGYADPVRKAVPNGENSAAPASEFSARVA